MPERELASIEARVFGPRAPLEPSSTFTRPLWPVIASLPCMIIPPLIWYFQITAPLREIPADIRFAFDMEYMQTIATALAGSAILAALLNCLWLALRVARARRLLLSSDLLVRLMSGWQPDRREAPLLAYLRRLEEAAFNESNKLLASQLRRAFQQLSYMQERETQPWPPMIVMIPFGCMLSCLSVIFIPNHLMNFLDYSLIQAGLLIGWHCWLHAFLAQWSESLLLRGYLRAIDNGTLDVRPPVQLEGKRA